MKKVLFSGVLVFMNLFAVSAQVPKGQFYNRAQLMVNYCQIDGDGASGFKKFGYSVGFLIGQGLGKNWAYETGATYSLRGSRSVFDINSNTNQFNYHFQMVDIPVYLVKTIERFELQLGLRTTYLLKAEDKDNNVQDLQSTLSAWNILGCAGVSFKVKPQVLFHVEYQYGLHSMNKQNNPSLLFPTGSYHNVVSMGFKLGIGEEAK